MRPQTPTLKTTEPTHNTTETYPWDHRICQMFWVCEFGGWFQSRHSSQCGCKLAAGLPCLTGCPSTSASTCNKKPPQLGCCTMCRSLVMTSCLCRPYKSEDKHPASTYLMRYIWSAICGLFVVLFHQMPMLVTVEQLKLLSNLYIG